MASARMMVLPGSCWTSANVLTERSECLNCAATMRAQTKTTGEHDSREHLLCCHGALGSAAGSVRTGLDCQSASRTVHRYPLYRRA
jgi:hypothetical protein